MKFGPSKVVSQKKKRPDSGRFAIHSADLNWVSCREQFQKNLQEDLPGFYFSTEPDQNDRVAAFLAKTERIIELETESEFCKTNLNFALWVAPDKFWLKCKMRASLLTILLRCGNLYDLEKDNYEEALFSHSYIQRTRSAVERFLFGFTDYTGDVTKVSGTGLTSTGWVTVFSDKRQDMIRNALIASVPTTEQCLVGAGKLWG